MSKGPPKIVVEFCEWVGILESFFFKHPHVIVKNNLFFKITEIR